MTTDPTFWQNEEIPYMPHVRSLRWKPQGKLGNLASFMLFNSPRDAGTSLLLLLVIAFSCPVSSQAQTNNGSDSSAQTAQAPNFDEDILTASRRLASVNCASADIRQVVRIGSLTLFGDGKFLLGPDNQIRFELSMPLSNSVYKRTNVVNQQVGYRIEEIFGETTIEVFRTREVMPLLRRKDLPPQLRSEMYTYVPFGHPRDILSGYLDTMTFFERSQQQIGTNVTRTVTCYKAMWRSTSMSGLYIGPLVEKVEELPPNIPQYLRLYLDEETAWPLRVELYRVENGTEQPPMQLLEFSKLQINPELNPADFEFTPPVDAEPTDVTETLTGKMLPLSDRSATASR